MFKEKTKQPKDLCQWLERINKQLERLILCQEKRLSGEVVKNFNSKKEVDNA